MIRKPIYVMSTYCTVYCCNYIVISLNILTSCDQLRALCPFCLASIININIQ